MDELIGQSSMIDRKGIPNGKPFDLWNASQARNLNGSFLRAGRFVNLNLCFDSRTNHELKVSFETEGRTDMISDDRQIYFNVVYNNTTGLLCSVLVFALSLLSVN